MKTTLIALALAAAVAFVPAAARPVVDADLTFTSKHVFRGLKLSDAAAQPSITAYFETIYLGLWASVPIRDSDELSELDAFAGWRQPLSENFSIDIGATMYRYWNTSPADVSNALGGTRHSQESTSAATSGCTTTVRTRSGPGARCSMTCAAAP